MQWFTCIIISPKVQTSGSASICWHHQRPRGGRSRKSMRERERQFTGICMPALKGALLSHTPMQWAHVEWWCASLIASLARIARCLLSSHHCTRDQEKCLDDFPMVVTGVPLFQPKLHMRSPDWPGWWFEICLCFHPANDRWNDDPQPRGELPNFLLLTVSRFCCEVSLIEGKRHCWCLTPVFSLLKSNCLGQIHKIYWIRLYLLASS